MTVLDLILGQFSASGRTSRRAFLKRWLKLFYLSVLVMAVGVFLASQGFRFAGYAAVALIALLILCHLSMIVRRLHDRSRSGWWLALLLGTEIGGYFLEEIEQSHPLTFLAVGFPLLVINLWLLIELFFRRGTVGPNRFGEDPSAPVA